MDLFLANASSFHYKFHDNAIYQSVCLFSPHPSVALLQLEFLSESENGRRHGTLQDPREVNCICTRMHCRHTPQQTL